MPDEGGWRILVHGGVDTPDAWTEGCEAAVDAAREALAAGQGALEAAVAATVALEDHPRYNAGTGAGYRLDGQTIELDAAVMDCSGRIGAVGAIQAVKNPVRVARAVADSPHALLVGEGAIRFARNLGHAEYDPTTDDTYRKRDEVAAELASGRLPRWRQRWAEIDHALHWNFEAPFAPYFATGDPAPSEGASGGLDTVGCVIADGATLAAALSTGGASPMMAGRLGDTPLPGAGYWVSAAAAVAVTGVGEAIIRELLARWVHDQIAAGSAPQAAAEAGVARFAADVPIGVIATTPHAIGVHANNVMAWSAWTGTARTSSA